MIAPSCLVRVWGMGNDGGKGLARGIWPRGVERSARLERGGCESRRRSGDGPIRCHHRARPRHRRDGSPVVRGGHWHPRRPHRRHRPARSGTGEAAYRCGGPSRSPRLHRHVGTIRVHPPGGPEGALESLPGHHDGDHRRRGIGRSGQRCNRARGRQGIRALRHQARLDRLRGLLRASGAAGNRHQHRFLCRRDDRARDGDRLRRPRGDARRARADAGSRRAGHASGRRRRVERARVCARTVCEHRGAYRAREHRRRNTAGSTPRICAPSRKRS